MAECAGTTCDEMSCASASDRLLTYRANSRQRQLLVETSNLDRRKPVLVACTNHGMEAALDPLQHFRVAFEDRKNFSIGLSEHTDRFCQTLCPVCQACAMVRCSKKHNAATTIKNPLYVWFRSLLCCSESLRADQQLRSSNRSAEQLTSSHTRPPRLWQMNMIGRLSCCCESDFIRRAATNAYSVILFSVASYTSQQVHRVVADPVL